MRTLVRLNLTGKYMVEQITLKVEFKYPQRLNIGEIYTLWHKSDPNQSITFEYLAKEVQ